MNTVQKAFSEGTVVGGRYEIQHLLGSGEARGAWLCRDLSGGEKRVVLKTLHPDVCGFGTASGYSDQFSLLRLLRHPGLVHVQDFGVCERAQVVFLTHEWVEGADVYTATEGAAIEKILPLMSDLARAMQYLHTRGLIHGNLRPSNVFLSAEDGGVLRIMDFGLIRGARHVRSGGGPGPLSYTAPEILLGGQANRHSDYYSLGILFYQLLTRHLPFEDADPGFLIQKHLQGSVDLRPIGRMPGGSRLSRLLTGLLQKDPFRRTVSAEEVLRLIDEALGRDHAETGIKELENYFSASQFVGREGEMTRLRESLHRVREGGRGCTVFITGEAGSGKTRCMEELRSWALLEGCRVVEGTCRAREEGSYSPYRQILANSEPVDGESLFQFQDAPRRMDGFESSSEHAAGQFRDLLTRELVRRLSARPSLLLLDDFHLADEATNTVLDYLSSDIQAYPVLICVGLRTGEEIAGGVERVMELVVRQDRGETLALEPLTQANVERLVEGMTGDARLKFSLGPWIFRSFGGNPFFIEEMLKHLVEQRLLFRESGAWRFVEEDLSRMEIPASVGVVLRKRLEQLPSPARKLANWLGLFRGSVPVSLLSSAMAINAGKLSEALKELYQRQMILMETAGSEAIVEFRHSLLAEVIRGDLPQKRRRQMHRRIAETIERQYGPDGHLHELALHYIEGESGSVAVRYALAVAAQSRAEFAHENALRCFEYIFKSREGLTDEQLCTAAIEASDTMFALGLPRRSVLFLKNEISRYGSISRELKARMFMQLALSFQHLGDLRMQEKYCKEGLRFFRHRPAAETNLIKAMLWAELAFAAILQSHSRLGLVYLEKARRSCPDKNADAMIGRMHNMSASLHRIAGNLHEALAASEKAAEILRDSQDSFLACSAYSMFGHILATLGKFSLALEKHERAVSLSDKSRSVVMRSQALANLAECLCRMGRVLEAANAAELAAKSVREANNPAISYAFNSILAEIKLAAGDYRGATRVVDRLDQDAKHNQAIYIIGHALYVEANLRFMLGDFDASQLCIEKLRRLKTREEPFYENELAEALDARILAERGLIPQALIRLRMLDNDLSQKQWPYQACAIKLHLCEIHIKQGRRDIAERYALDALSLAASMEAASYISYAKLLLGCIYSPVHNQDGKNGIGSLNSQPGGSPERTETAVEQLEHACQIAENSYLLDTAWRAHAELCRVLYATRDITGSLEHARTAYELLCKIEEQVPSEMLPRYCGALGRSRSKSDLVRLIESGRDTENNGGVTVTDIRDKEQARILLRVSATVNSIRELNPLLEAILDQLMPAVNVERAFVFLRDELTGILQFVKGRNSKRESMTGTEQLDRSILAEVLRNEKPIVSADTGNDPRLPNKGLMSASASGKLLCAPLKLSDRVLGVLYADHSQPAGTLSDSTISLFAAFCNLAAIAIDNVLAHRNLVKEKAELARFVHQARDGYEEIVGNSECMELLRDRIGLASNSPVDILILGESGTGKELVAQAIFRTGLRKSGKFIPVDCGSLSDNLAEAELFGFRKGAFTGAAENRQGLIEAANGGILFLDELSNLPYRLQAKLLRVIQEREIRRLGENTPRKVDFQLIAATNKELIEEVRNGQFREDLYYRLKAFEIRVPPLRERAEDIPLLIERFLEEIEGSPARGLRHFLPESVQLLKKYTYPGNVRELRNIVIGTCYSTAKERIGIDELPPEVRYGVGLSFSSESSEAASIYRDILAGNGDFESLVKKPFLRHRLELPAMRDVIKLALEDTGGRYRDAFLLLRIPDTRYSVTLQFLKRHKCRLDFRPIRRKRR